MLDPATNEHLPDRVTAGDFRGDLLDRLTFDVITLPPLRERGEDILRLAEFFGIQMASELGLDNFPGWTREAEAAFQKQKAAEAAREAEEAEQQPPLLARAQHLHAA